MLYVLITPKGQTLNFFTKGAAELFKNMYGGYVVHKDELKLAA